MVQSNPLRTEVLTWDRPNNNHEFRLCNNGTATLMIRKKRGNNTLPVQLGITSMDEVMKAWKAQGGAWKQVFEKKPKNKRMNPYIAIRLITIEERRHIVWYVYHLNDNPADACSQWIGTPQEIVNAYIDEADQQ